MDKKTLHRIMGLLALIVAFYVALQNTDLVAGILRYLFGLIAPFLVGGGLAFVLNVPMQFLEKKLFAKKKRYTRLLSILLTLTLVFGVISIVLFMVVPELYQSVSAIAEELTNARERIPEALTFLSEKLPLFSSVFHDWRLDFMRIDWKEMGAMLLAFLQNGSFLSDTYNWASSVFNGVTNFILGLVFAIYILAQKETLGRQFRRLFYAFCPERRVDRFLSIIGRIGASFHSFLSGQCLEGFILGGMFFVSMSILRLPYALVIAVLIAVTSLVPIFGTFIGCAIGLLLILMISPMKALWFLILFLVLQQIEGNLIYPRVVGGSVGLPSIWVLAAVTLGANIAGVLGILFSIPIMSVVYTMLRETVKKRIDEHAVDPEKIK